MNRHQSVHAMGNLPKRQFRTRRPALAALGFGILISALLWIPGSAAWGQSTSTLPPQLRELERNIPAISDLLSSTTVQAATGVVRLDGRKLFTVTADADSHSANADSPAPIDVRMEIIEDRLWMIVDRGFEPDSLQITSELDSSSRQPIIYASYLSKTSDSREGEDSDRQRQELLTVTDQDAKVNGSDINTWAGELTGIIKEALLTAQQERQPQYLQQQAKIAAGVLVVMLLASLLVTQVQRRLRTERRKLRVQSQTEQITAADSPTVTTALLQRRVANQEKLGVNDVKRRLMQFTQILIWGGGLFALLGLFPYTRWLQPMIISWVKIPVRFLVIGLITYVAIRLSGVVIDRVFLTLQDSTSLAPSTSQRLMLRFTTFSRVTKSITVIGCGVLGVLLAIVALGIQVSPALLTAAGIVGVGISLASQNLIKDYINGFLILMEDQFGVGDVIVVGDVAGLVENMNLRITQLRNDEGRLITIPNSTISVVQNLSMEWSRVDLSISVAYSADLDRALAVIERVAQDMSQDPSWRDLIVESPKLLGVDKLDYVGATIRLWIKTQPLKQWDVAREYRRRLKHAFDQAEIPIGIPQQSLWVNAPEHRNGIHIHDDRRQPAGVGSPQ